MLEVAAWRRFEPHPGIDLISCFRPRNTKGPIRGAHRNLYQKTVAAASPYGEQSGGDCRMHAGADRPVGKEAVALRSLPPAVPRGSRYSPRAGVARFVDAEAAIDLALPSAAGGMSSLWGAGGGVSVGGAVGTSDYGPVQCGSGAGAGVELARHGARVWAELEK